MRNALLCAVLCAALVSPALADHAATAPQRDSAIGKTCKAATFRQFDFWLGHWVVSNPAGEIVGHSRITRISQGCAIHEQWLGRASTGNSLNYYDAKTRQWHQDWVGSGGLALHLHGNLSGTSMVLVGTRRDAKGRISDRITWTPLSHGRVRQHWEVSRNQGRTWKTVFLGTYTREPAPTAP